MTSPLTPPDEPKIKYSNDQFVVLCFLMDKDGNEDGLEPIVVKGRSAHSNTFFEINELVYNEHKNFNSIETDVVEYLRGRGFKDFEINVRFPN